MKKVPLSEVTCPWCGEVMDGVKRVDNVKAADGMHSGIQCNHCGIKIAADIFDLDDMTLICNEDHPTQLEGEMHVITGVGKRKGLQELQSLLAEKPVADLTDLLLELNKKSC